MGLDQYAYVAAKAGQQSEFYEGSQFDKETGDYVNILTYKAGWNNFG
jgi:hypothetical protein